MTFEESADRLSFASMLFAIGFFLSWSVAPAEAQPEGTFPMLDVAAVAAIAISMAVFWIARRIRTRPRLLSDVALTYEVVACFAIAISEQWLPWPSDYLVRGISWACLVLVAFPLTVPTTPRRAMLASLLGATCGPLALVLTLVKGNPLPPPKLLLSLFLPPYLAAGLAYILSRVIYKLGKDVLSAKKLGAYELEARLGIGGMGEVWRARHRLLARPAAVKLVRAEALGHRGSPQASAVLRRFEHEARATASLESPHTISLYDFGVTEDGTFYYVMELLEGLDLESIVEMFGPLPEARAVHLLIQACHSLEEAHGRGMIHRDVKPANIYVCRVGLDYDFVKVLDFGLVISEPGAAEPLTRLTADGFTSGTPAYMAPEMAASGASVDARADLYGLGCVAYFMLTGRLVFESPSPMKLIAEHLASVPVPPSERASIVLSKDVEAIVLACLEKDPGRRPESARDLADRLRASSAYGKWRNADAKAWWAANREKVAPERLPSVKPPKVERPVTRT